MKTSGATNIKTLSLILCLITVFSLKADFSWSKDDFSCKLSGLFRPEMFYGKNFTLLNSCNYGDRVWYERHILDLKLNILYGQKTYGQTAAEFKIGMRNKSVWGNPKGSAQTTFSELKISQSVHGAHNHFFPRHVFWIREIWLDFGLQQVLGLSCFEKQHFTLGAFKFELGRGIALGAAYAVGSELLGFYDDSVIDQFAFGAKLSGPIKDKRLSYDLYAAILQNQSASLSDTGARIYGQEYGRRERPARGFGKINYLCAGRLNWIVFDRPCIGKLTCEPYWLFNDAPEQRVEFLGDARSKLTTLGLASEYCTDTFECGFDYAMNFGEQDVRGWDRNRIMIENRDGYLVEVNSDVVDVAESKVLYIPGSDTQETIEDSTQSEAWNGKEIEPDLYNSAIRFRDPYSNRYKGWMATADAGWWVYKKDLQVAVTAGIASGDGNPNEIGGDKDYNGFIGLQEIYSGKRVRSALVQERGRIKRPLSVPLPRAIIKFPRNISGFTNLRLVGVSCTWEPKERRKAVKVMPNMISYWQDYPSRKYDAFHQQDLNECASMFLGIEFNLFFDYYVLENMKIYFVSACFIPGRHYSDVKGKPLTSEQEKALNRYNRTGFLGGYVPNLGDNVAYTMNLGVEFTF